MTARIIISLDKIAIIQVREEVVYLYNAMGWPRSGIYCFGMLAYLHKS